VSAFSSKKMTRADKEEKLKRKEILNKDVGTGILRLSYLTSFYGHGLKYFPCYTYLYEA